MKTKTLIAAAALSVLFVHYATQLSKAVESSVGESTPSNQQVLGDTSVKTFSFALGSLPDKRAERKSKHNRFLVDNSVVTEVVGRGGTKLSFPTNSFEDSKGRPVAFGVELVMEECYGLNEILAEKLSTTSGASIIETAGMINIRASKNGRELRLRNGVSYQIAFPTNGSRGENFELFYGARNENGVMDWTRAGRFANNDEVKTLQSAATASIRDDCFIQICESEFRRRTLVSEMDYFNWQLVGGQTLNQWFVSNFNPDAQMADDFCANKLFSQITFHLNEDGSFKDYYISHESKRDYDRVIAEFLSTMPPLDLSNVMPVYSTDHACILSFGHKQGSSNGDFVRRFAKKYDYENTDAVMTDVNTSDLDFYMFSSTELGWINCDRFIQEESPLVNFYVDAKCSDGASVSMVFEDRKSIVRGIREGERYVFSGVPSNQNVRLIAMDNASGNPTMEVKRTNTSILSCRLDNYQPMTLARLDGAMCWR